MVVAVLSVPLRLLAVAYIVALSASLLFNILSILSGSIVATPAAKRVELCRSGFFASETECGSFGSTVPQRGSAYGHRVAVLATSVRTLRAVIFGKRHSGGSAPKPQNTQHLVLGWNE